MAEVIDAVKKRLNALYKSTYAFKSDKDPAWLPWHSLVFGEDSALQYNSSGHLVYRVCNGEEHALHVSEGGRMVRMKPVTDTILLATISKVQKQSVEVVNLVLADMERRFPPSPVMKAMGVCFPQWYNHHARSASSLRTQVEVLAQVWGEAKVCNGEEYPPLLDSNQLVAQSDDFFSVASRHAPEALAAVAAAREAIKAGSGSDVQRKVVLPAATVFWRRMSQNKLLASRYSEFLKLAEAVLVQTSTSVEEERTFSNMAFIKNRMRNRLDVHLNECVRLFHNPFFPSIGDMPVGKATRDWLQAKARRSTTQVVAVASAPIVASATVEEAMEAATDTPAELL